MKIYSHDEINNQSFLLHDQSSDRRWKLHATCSSIMIECFKSVQISPHVEKYDVVLAATLREFIADNYEKSQKIHFIIIMLSKVMLPLLLTAQGMKPINQRSTIF